jgi:hypothetical protein
MSDKDKMNELDTYSSIKSLSNFLKTDVKVTSGIIEDRVTKKGEPIQTEGYSVKVKISNSAPVESSYPAVVFTGVGLAIKFPNTRHTSIHRMKSYKQITVDISEAPQQEPFQREGERIDGAGFSFITSDERQTGYILAPGQSIKYEINLLSKDCPDIKDLKLWVEGNISRRYLFRCKQEIPITNENVIYEL